jgi:[protein-PII] uridylyltransferase
MRHLELNDETLRHISENLPASYVLNTSLPTMATHLKLLEQLPKEKVIVDFYQSERDSWSEMSVVAYDDPEPGLLSKICGVVYAAGMDIKLAQVFTLSDWRHQEPNVDGVPSNENNDESSTRDSDDAPDIVLDLLNVSRAGRALSSSQSAKLALQIREVLLGEKTVNEIVEASGKNNPTGISPLKISVRNDLSDEHSVVTMVNENVPGLMFHITRALAALKWDIHSAKVTTWAGRAEDAFYITRRIKEKGATRQQKIADDEIKTEIERLKRRLRRAG